MLYRLIDDLQSRVGFEGDMLSFLGLAGHSESDNITYYYLPICQSDLLKYTFVFVCVCVYSRAL